MLEITRPRFKDLTEDEKENASSDGGGQECAGYIRVTHGGETILLKSDAMEPEDASFGRNLSWISGIIQKSYELGKAEDSCISSIELSDLAKKLRRRSEEHIRVAEEHIKRAEKMCSWDKDTENKEKELGVVYMYCATEIEKIIGVDNTEFTNF